LAIKTAWGQAFRPAAGLLPGVVCILHTTPSGSSAAARKGRPHEGVFSGGYATQIRLV